MDLGTVNHFKEVTEYGNKRTPDQNAYMFGAICNPLKVRLNQDGWDFTEYGVYKWLENKFSKVDMVNEKTGETFETIKPLKELSTEEWDEIVTTNIRNYCEHNLGIYIELPHEYYKMTLEAYNLWKKGEITFKQAVEQSKGITDNYPQLQDS